MRKLTTEEFIERAKKVHGDKYDYSKTEYANNYTKVCIICPEHGEFWQTPNCHLDGQGCPKCGIKKRSVNKTLTTEEFIKKAMDIHGDKYDYSKVQYLNNRTKVCIICPEHGEFWQTPHNHLKGNGCPKCRNSHLEKFVENLLIEENIKFIQSYKTKWLKKQHLDFFLPEYNVAIECQGEQHFVSFRFEKDNKNLLLRKKRDELKKKLCEENNIRLIYFSNTIKQDVCLGQKIIKNKNDLIKEIYV